MIVGLADGEIVGLTDGGVLLKPDQMKPLLAPASNFNPSLEEDIQNHDLDPAPICAVQVTP